MANPDNAAQPENATQREQIEYNGSVVPIYRQSIAEIYIALEPPQAEPYVVAPVKAPAEDIVRFFSERIERVEYLRERMLKRFEKTSSEKCTYQTGDIAYVMGRPFMVEVNPLGRSRGVKGGARGRATITYTIDIEVSLISLYVMKVADYDQRKSAFLIYGRSIVSKNAAMLAQRYLKDFGSDKAVPSVRTRSIRGEFAKVESGALWVSDDIVPYPVPCLAYAVGRAIGEYVGASEEEIDAVIANTVPNRERIRNILATRAKPFSNQ